MKKLNFFSGKNALFDFFNPDKNAPLPLIEIPNHLNPFYKEGVRIYAKMLNMLPLSNIKSLPALSMLQQAKRVGNLEGVDKLIENSSGNTVLSLAVLGRLFGISRTKAFVSHEISPGKLKLLRLFNVEALVNEEPICPDPSDKESGIYKAQKIGNKSGWFNAGQYENEENPKSHEKWTAKQIWEQLGGDIQLFCAGLGTTGTMVGCSKFFKKRNKFIKTVGVIRSPNNPVPGVRTRGLLNMIAFDWKKYTDCFEEIGTKESFEKSLDLIRSGLVVGPSSGFALAGLLKNIQSLKEQKKLDELKNKSGKINSVFICCDSPFPYLDDYFIYLDKNNFPKIVNEDLLEKTGNRTEIFSEDLNFELEPMQVYNLIYKIDKEKLEKSIKKNSKINLDEGISVIDIRKREDYDHFHLAGSVNLEFKKIITSPRKHLKSLIGKKIIVVCNIGLKSNTVTRILRKNGFEAYNLMGGITEWSNLNLPRWRPNVCLNK